MAALWALSDRSLAPPAPPSTAPVRLRPSFPRETSSYPPSAPPTCQASSSSSRGWWVGRVEAGFDLKKLNMATWEGEKDCERQEER